MFKRAVTFLPHSVVFLLFIAAFFSYAHVNWKETIFLFALFCAYAVDRIFRIADQRLRRYFVIFVSLFLLCQFYINDFHPGAVEWWLTSMPGWLAVVGVYSWVVALAHRGRADRRKEPYRTDSRDYSDTLGQLIGRTAPGMIVVNSALFFLFLFNVEQISPARKLVPDYSLYVVIGFGFGMFYPLHTILQSLSSEKTRTAITYALPILLMFLILIGSVNVYRVSVVYHTALRTGESPGAPDPETRRSYWEKVRASNRIPDIQSINIDALVALGRIAAQQGESLEAVQYYRHILAGDVFNYNAILGLAETASIRGEWRMARDIYKRVLHLRPAEQRHIAPYVHACIMDDRIDEAIAELRSLNTSDPIMLQEPEDYVAIGNSFFERGHVEEAIDYLQHAKALVPRNYRGLVTLGRAYVKAGRYVNGCRILEEAIRSGLEKGEGYYHLAVAYRHLGRDLDAIDMFSAAVRCDQKNIAWLHDLKELYAKVGLERQSEETQRRIDAMTTKVIKRGEWHGVATWGAHVFRNGNMYWNGRMGATALLKEGTATFIFQAYGSPAKGVWPHMVVRLEDDIVGEVDVASRELKEYTFTKAVDAGRYELSATFTNDAALRDQRGGMIEDRNLFVRRCWIVYEK